MAGLGKSSITWTISLRADDDPEIIFGGSFFCSRSTGLAAQRDIRCVIPTLAQLLARQSPEFSVALAAELALDPDVLEQQVEAQVRKLLYKPLGALRGAPRPVLFVIDALDECGGETGNEALDNCDSHRIVSDVLEALVALFCTEHRLPVKFLVTSRPETHIRDTPVSDEMFSKVLRLHTVDKDEITADIRLYIANQLSSTPRLRSQFTTADYDSLVRVCDGIFIVAATALRYTLDGGRDRAAVRFRTLLDASKGTLSINAAAPLDRMYSVILSDAASTDELPALRQALAAILVARMSLSVSALADLLEVTTADILATLSFLHSVIHVPDDDDDDEASLRPLHASFGDYLFERAPSHIRLAESLGHEVLAPACLRLMKRRLYFNIMQAKSSYEPNALTRPDSVTLALEYACLHWIHHVSAQGTRMDDTISEIFFSRLLAWLEVMSGLGEVSRAAAMMIFAAATVGAAHHQRS